MTENPRKNPMRSVPDWRMNALGACHSPLRRPHAGLHPCGVAPSRCASLMR